MHPIARKLLLLPLLLLTFATTAPAPARAAVAWRGWNEGMQEARRSGRPVLVDVYTNWCGWCKRMDADVYARRDVGEYLAARFVLVKLNAESSEQVSWRGRSMTARALASTFDVSGYPTTIFFDAGGEHLANVPGYIPADRFQLLVRYIGDGHMARNEPWDDYVKKAAPAR